MSREVISIIMGGGRGTRLYPLTKYRCKPAVPLAGKYRLVDIPISNCINSGCNKIYLLSQFNTASLHKHVLQTYKFDSFGKGFIDILAAEQTENGSAWYQGTADAVRKNMHHFERHADSSYFLILSGDQLYQMNFSKMIDYHISSGADVTIAAKPMPREEAPSLGIMRVNEDLQIVQFCEKPKEKELIDSLVLTGKLREHVNDGDKDYCLASMGIYVFSQKILENAMRGSEMDFGKEIIPGLLGSKKLNAYVFNGYWEDIGTVRSFFDANLALSDKLPDFDFYRQDKIIYTHSRYLPSSKFYNCSIDNSNVADGSILNDVTLKRCVIGLRSIIDPGSVLENVITMGADFFESVAQKADNAKNGMPNIGIGKNCKIKNAIIDKNARIGDNCVLSPEGKPEGWEQDCFYVRDGVLLVTKNGIVPSGTVL